DARSSFLYCNATDRLWVSWPLSSQRVRERLERKPRVRDLPLELGKVARLIQAGGNGLPCRGQVTEALQGKPVLIEIPADIGRLQQERPQSALEWREATRWAFTRSMEAGYLVEDFYEQTRGAARAGAYLLSKVKIEDVRDPLRLTRRTVLQK
ncbi:MAG: hypothetical protein L0338_18030, partial [Acidobacteria bacterium]|nr:hypothetical protein [Acidobacteriota bacterium]